MSIKAKTFLKALDLFTIDTRSAKSFLTDKRLTQSEKTILEAFFLIRDNKLQQAIDKLLPLQTENRFVESQRVYALASAYNNKGHFEEAQKWFNISLSLVVPLNLRKREFATRYNIFLVHLNLKNYKALKQDLKELQAMGSNSPFEKISILSCEFAYHLSLGDTHAANSSLEGLSALKAKMSDSQIVNYYMDCFDFGIKTDDFKMANKSLEELKDHRKFRLSANFTFMRVLLSHLETNSPLYVYEHEFKDHPWLYYQVMVLKHLSSDERELAQGYWQRLMELSPEMFHSDFRYQGPKCIFSVCLEKHAQKKLLSFSLSTSNKVLMLEELLHGSKSPLSKENIFKILYQRDPESKDDFKKLQSLMSIVRKRVKFKIVYKHGCYQKAS